MKRALYCKGLRNIETLENHPIHHQFPPQKFCFHSLFMYIIYKIYYISRVKIKKAHNIYLFITIISQGRLMGYYKYIYYCYFMYKEICRFSFCFVRFTKEVKKLNIYVTHKFFHRAKK